MIRLGGHGVDADPAGDPLEFAKAHKRFGYGAAYCPPVDLNDAARLRAIEQAFAAENVKIAELGIWKNITAVEPEVRQSHQARAIECLAIADEVDAGCAVTYIGTYEPNSDYAPHPKNLSAEAFDLAVVTVRRIIDSVKPKRAKFALEMMQYALPDSVDCYLDLIRAVDRPAFAAHVDPVNLIMTPRTYYNTTGLLNEIFSKLGNFIVSCHAKDITLYHQAALHLDEVMIGDGPMDYAAFLREIERLGRDVPLMLEHLEHADYGIARDRVFGFGDAAGIGFVNRA
ncbi:MAG: sugar phosphate isomerase/epimerase [Hyphomicrobiaceae bacterium]|nr:sugar phosphate isomerase/epimerase [Hyphomicrobiaceae bacterium]